MLFNAGRMLDSSLVVCIRILLEGLRERSCILKVVINVYYFYLKMHVVCEYFDMVFFCFVCCWGFYFWLVVLFILFIFFLLLSLKNFLPPYLKKDLLKCPGLQ